MANVPLGYICLPFWLLDDEQAIVVRDRWKEVIADEEITPPDEEELALFSVFDQMVEAGKD